MYDHPSQLSTHRRAGEVVAGSCADCAEEFADASGWGMDEIDDQTKENGMTTAGEVAAELRKLADALDTQPDVEVVKPWITFYCHEKDPFLNIARILPRPLKKKVEDPEKSWARVKVVHETDAIDITVSVPQSLTCELIEPAKPAVYRCEPILSEVEEEEVVK